MKKADLMEYGIPEAKIRAFNEVYWNDVRKQAARMVEEAKGQEAAPSTASMREAIAAMVRVIPDPVRLSMILNNVNRHYQYYTNEQNGVKGNQNNQTTNAQKQPEVEQEGATEAEAPLPVLNGISISRHRWRLYPQRRKMPQKWRRKVLANVSEDSCILSDGSGGRSHSANTAAYHGWLQGEEKHR